MKQQTLLKVVLRQEQCPVIVSEHHKEKITISIKTNLKNHFLCLYLFEFQINQSDRSLRTINQNLNSYSQGQLIKVEENPPKEENSYYHQSRVIIEESVEEEEGALEKSKKTSFFTPHLHREEGEEKKEKAQSEQNSFDLQQRMQEHLSNSRIHQNHKYYSLDTTDKQFIQQDLMEEKQQNQSQGSPGIMFASHLQSTSSNREWALETLLKEERVNVKTLEDRNKALKDRITSLENMLKTSLNSTKIQQSMDNKLNETQNSQTKPFQTRSHSQPYNTLGDTQQSTFMQTKVLQLQSDCQQLQMENDRLRFRLEGLLKRVEDFESEKSLLKQQNNTKMSTLESKIAILENELNINQRNYIDEKNQTIKGLETHVKVLENKIYHYECLNKQNQNLQNSQASFGGRQTSSIIQAQMWEAKVKNLEQQLNDTKNYYVNKVQSLERQQQRMQYEQRKSNYDSEYDLTQLQNQRLVEQIENMDQQIEIFTIQINNLQEENNLLQKLISSIQVSAQFNYQDAIRQSMKDQRMAEFLELRRIVDLCIIDYQQDTMTNKTYNHLERVITLIEEIVSTTKFKMLQSANTSEIQVRSNQQSAIKTGQDEEYWSDFSDENFQVEKQEEKESLNLLFHLQLWIQEKCKHNETFLRLFKPFEQPNSNFLMTEANLQTVLLQLGFEANEIMLSNLIKTLPKQREGFIDYKQLITNLKYKPFDEVSEILSFNAFEIQNQITKEGNFTSIFNQDPKQRQFYHDIIRRKLQDYESTIINQFKKNSRRVMSKRDFRKIILNQKINLTRFETHFIVREMEQDGQISVHNFNTFMEEFNEMPSFPKEQKKGRDQISDTDFQDLMKITKTHIQSNNINIIQLLKSFDIYHNETIDFISFQRLFQQAKIPLSKMEVYSIFQTIFKVWNKEQQLTTNSRININDFARLLKQDFRGLESQVQLRKPNLPLQSKKVTTNQRISQMSENKKVMKKSNSGVYSYRSFDNRSLDKENSINELNISPRPLISQMDKYRDAITIAESRRKTNWSSLGRR